MTKTICGLVALLALNTNVVCAIAQEEPRFQGTWRVDIEAYAQMLTEAAVPAERLQMSVNRMRNMRYILNDDELIIVTDHFPQRMEWTLVKKDQGNLEFSIQPENQVVRLAVLADDVVEFTTVVGDQNNSLRLVKESAAETWAQPQEFQIGMRAPPIAAERWVTEIDQPIEVGNGQVYVLDFWATWCGPCLVQMPKLAELQQKQGTDKLRVVAISNEPWEAVEGFLIRPTNRDNAPSLGEQVKAMSQTMAIGVDQNGETFRAYMVAAGLRALPMTFIIGSTGHVEWAGDSQEIETVLPQILDGTWDRAEFAQRFAGVQRAYTDFPQIQQLVSRGQLEAAQQLIDELIPLADSRMRGNLENFKARLTAQQPKQ